MKIQIAFLALLCLAFTFKIQKIIPISILIEKVQSASSTALALRDPQQCIQQKCPNEWKACQADSKCIPTLQDCQKKCGTKQTCWQLCLSKQGDSAATNVAKCAAKNGCLSQPQVVQIYGFQTCMKKSCQLDHSQCLADKMCRSYLLQCRIKDRIWQFNLQCLIEKSAFSPKVQRWLKCGGQNKCL